MFLYVHEKWRKRLQATMSADISQEVKICIEIALKCVESDRVKRPTINQIVDELDKIDNAKSSSTSQVAGFRKKQDFNKLYTSSDSTVGFNDDEPIITAPPTSVQLVMKNNKEAPLEENDQKVMLELTGDQSSIDRPGLDLVVVLDVSGSMSGHKIRQTKTAMQFVVRKLCPVDRLSIVTFNSDATRECPLRQVTQTSKLELQGMVDRLMARGSTNIEAGLRTGLKVLTDRKVSDGRVAGVMLMSDGQQNSNTDAAVVPVGKVPVYTFAFGRQADSELLNTVAAKSMGGIFSFVDDRMDGAVTIAFSQCLAGLLTIAAQDLYLTVTASRVGDESTTIQKITTGSYLQTQHSDDPGSMTVAFGHLYNKEVRKVIVYLSLPAVESERSADILKVTYSYSSSSGSGREFVATLTVLRTGVAVRKDGPEEVRTEEIRLQAAEMIRAARMLADCDNLKEAEWKLMDALNLVEADQYSNPFLLAELHQLLQLFSTQYKWHGHVYALVSETSHGRQRFAVRGGDAGSTRLFATPRMDKYLKEILQKSPVTMPLFSMPRITTTTT
ncbi:uncharacterized protein [Lolium perenne]|uniref:uncharacterized protein isoform X2 n=1 Tax=Lolium perenne TaxID=4522 RepID=UPI003A99B171